MQSFFSASGSFPARRDPRRGRLSRPAAAVCLLLAWSGAAHATFEERTIDAGFVGSGATWGAQAIDVDTDGDIDVVSGTHFNPPRMFTNDGTGSFSLGGIPPLAQNDTDRHGFLWVDLDGDGLTDVLCSHGGGGGCVSCEVTGNELWRGLGGGLFQLIPGAGGMADSIGRGRAFAAADIDGDGDLDLHHSQAPLALSPNALFRNDGNMNFVNVAAAWGVDEGEGTVTGLFADYDDDGDPDLLVGGEEFARSTILWRNDGTNFVDVTAAAFGSLPIVAGADWGDFDNDGDLDLLIVEGDEGVFDAWRVEGKDFQFFANHRFGDDGVDAYHMNSLGGNAVGSFRWRGAFIPDKVFLGPDAIPQPSPLVLLTDAYVGAPTFTPGVDEGLYCWRESPGGTWQFHVTAPPATFGSYVGIIYTPGGVGSPGDSNLETLTVTPRQPRLYRNDGGTFTELTGLGFTTSANPRSVTWVDFDNDGDLDVHQTNKGTIAIANEQDILWRNDSGSFTALQGADWAPGDTHHLTDGGVWGDLDGDGDLDLYVLEGTGPDFPDNIAAPIYYRNNGPAGNWISLFPERTAAGGTSVGTAVTCWTGGSPVHRRLQPSAWRGFQSPLDLHFGLASATGVDSVTIAWPGGGTQTLGPMPGGRSYRFAEGEDPLPASMNIVTASPDSVAPPSGSLQVEVLNAAAQRVRGEEWYLSLTSLSGLVTPGTPSLNADSTYSIPYTTLALGLDSLVVSDGALADTLLLQVTYFPDAVTISPDAVRIHWIDALPLGVSIRNRFGARVPDQGTALSVTSLQGAGSVGAPVFQSDSSYAVTYTPVPSTGVTLDTLVAFDPEAVSADRDTSIVEITDTAILSAVTDIPGDEGGQVRVRWQKDLHDTLGAGPPVDHYVVWRRVDGTAARDGSPRTVVSESEGTFRALGAIWEPVGPQIPAMLWDQYASVVPTLVDSTATEGIRYSVFLVSAHTTDPGVFMFSAPDSGYSVDNLAPVPPASLRLVGGTLSWEEAPVEDFDHFACYGGPTPELEHAESLGSTRENLWDVSGSDWSWYFVTAVDVSGNASAPAVVQNGATAVVPAGNVPASFALQAPNPNPFSGATSIGFDLPEPSFVRLSIYDVSGRLVRVLANETLPAGRHVRRWLGRSRAESVAMPGVYFVRLEAGPYTAVRKIVQLR